VGDHFGRAALAAKGDGSLLVVVALNDSRVLVPDEIRLRTLKSGRGGVHLREDLLQICVLRADGNRDKNQNCCEYPQKKRSLHA